MKQDRSPSSVRIEKSWVFGNYTRELTFDQISDIYVNQGILARMFDCDARVDDGTVTPTMVKDTHNMLWDILSPDTLKT